MSLPRWMRVCPACGAEYRVRDGHLDCPQADVFAFVEDEEGNLEDICGVCGADPCECKVLAEGL